MNTCETLELGIKEYLLNNLGYSLLDQSSSYTECEFANAN